MVCAVVLPSRLRSLNRAFGIESVIEMHRFLGVVTGVLVLAAPGLRGGRRPGQHWRCSNFPRRPGGPRAAIARPSALIAIVLLAVLKRRFDLSATSSGGGRTSRSPSRCWSSLGGAHLLLDQTDRRAGDRLAATSLFVAVVLVIFGYRWAWRSSSRPVDRVPRPRGAAGERHGRHAWCWSRGGRPAVRPSPGRSRRASSPGSGSTARSTGRGTPVHHRLERARRDDPVHDPPRR